MKTIIGNQDLLKSIPKLIQLNKEFYILTKTSDDSPILYSADCPHRHGIVDELTDKIWKCPSHDWTFDPDSGKCINAPQENLKNFPVSIENFNLVVELPEKKSQNLPTFDSTSFPKITLVSNACLLIEWNGKNILTDPWIEGPAIYGSWIHYPPNNIHVNDLPEIDYIIISHEHTDHLNEKTLSLINKNIPIFVPHFKIGRLKKKLSDLGFTKIFSIPSEKPFFITKDIKIVFFHSNSMWNDSVILIQLENFKILNVNDAGFNWSIPRFVGDVDLVCSAFSFGASAYPLNWTHIDPNSKIEIMKSKNLGMLKMLKQITSTCNAKYLLPFANFNELGPKKLRSTAKLQIKNSPRDVVDFFKDEKTKVLEMFPNESWDAKSGKISKRIDHEELLDRKKTIEYLDKNFNEEVSEEFFPTQFTITHDDLRNYFEKFSESLLSKQVGLYSVLLIAYDEKRTLSAKISFKNGIVEYESEPIQTEADMKMICPGGLVQDIIQKDLPWDEIQYWTEHSRKKDEYNVAFWKILHVPWEARNDSFVETFDVSKKNIAIATLLETGGEEANSIFEEFGLYCSACDASIGETIEEGCKMHGLSDISTQELKTKIDKLFQLKIRKHNECSN